MTFLGCLVWLLPIQCSQAAIVYEDHFLIGTDAASGQYLVDTPLGVSPAQNPTITNANTVTGAYVNGGTGAHSSAVSIRSVNTGLTFGPNFPVSGGSIESYRTGANNANSDSFSVRRAAANNSATTLTAPDAFFFSALIQYVPNFRIGIGLDFESSTITNNFGVGFDTAGNIGIMGNTTNTGKLSTETALLSPVNNGGSAFTAGTYLVVGKITPVSGGADTISVLLATSNPLSVPVLEPAALTSNSTLNVWENSTADTLENYWFFFQKSPTGGGTVVGRVDEFRVTTTYAEAVQAVPEPSVFLWSGLAAVGLWGWRRQRNLAC